MWRRAKATTQQNAAEADDRTVNGAMHQFIEDLT
jgi:hypothetical protein